MEEMKAAGKTWNAVSWLVQDRMAGRNLSLPYVPAGAKRIDDDDEDSFDTYLTLEQNLNQLCFPSLTWAG